MVYAWKYTVNASAICLSTPQMCSLTSRLRFKDISSSVKMYQAPPDAVTWLLRFIIADGCVVQQRRSRYHAGDARLWCSSRTKPHDPSASCLPACKSRVFVLGDARAQHAVHYSWSYATAETLFQRSRTESDQLENQKVRYRRVLLFLWWCYRAPLAVLHREKHQGRSVSFPPN